MYDTVIRPFVPPDQQAARVLILRGLGEHFGWIDETCNPDLDDIAATYTGAGHLFLVAERAGTLMGTAALVLADDVRVGRRGQMVRVSVAAEARRMGVGRALVAQLVQAAREHGIERVIVETNADWDDAIGLYQRCGFTIRERRDGGVLLALELA
jgi:ribosomal protein S18 acetylase RimI-like enzyme